MKKVAAARREVIDANKRLKELNDELHLSNAQRKEANHSIAENSYLKEEYIGRYMDPVSYTHLISASLPVSTVSPKRRLLPKRRNCSSASGWNRNVTHW